MTLTILEPLDPDRKVKKALDPDHVVQFASNIYYSKLGAVSWVQICPSIVYGKSWSILNLPKSTRLQIQIIHPGLQIDIKDADR